MERRSNEAIRSFRGAYGNRGSGASEVCSDDSENPDLSAGVFVAKREGKIRHAKGHTTLAADEMSLGYLTGFVGISSSSSSGW